MPDQFAVRRQGITSDEEERIRMGYKISEHYHSGPRLDIWELTADNKSLLTIAYEHNGSYSQSEYGDPKD